MAASGGDLNKLSIEQQQRAVRALSGPLSGMENLFGSGQTGRELLEKAGGVLPESVRADRLSEKSVAVMIDAANAQKALADHQRALYERFINELGTENRNFLNELGKAVGASPAALDNFGKHTQQLAQVVGNLHIPERIELTGNHKVDVNVVGAESMRDGIKELVTNEIDRAIKRYNRSLKTTGAEEYV